MRSRCVAALAVLWLSAGLARGQDVAELLRSPNVYPEGSDAAKEASQRIGKWLRAERDRVNDADLDAWRKIKDRAGWERHRDAAVDALRTSLGSVARAGAPTKVQKRVSRTLDGDGFAIDNLVYESQPGLWVTANLYRPTPRPASSPVILVVHSHHNPKTQGELQDMGMTWARQGCCVLVPDMLGHGERREHPFHSDKDYAKPFKAGRQDYWFRYNLGTQLHLAGESLVGWMARDLMAGVTLLLDQPAADPKRVILLGSVAGGGDPTGVTAALDPRITCVAPFNFGGPQPETKFPLPEDAERSFNYVGGGSWETTRNLRFTSPGQFAPWLIVGSVAPRGLIHSHEFAWDEKRDPVWKRYQQIFAWTGSDRLAVAHGRGSLQGKYPESTHCNNIGPEHRSMIHPVLAKWFQIPEPKEYSNRRKSEELQCWTPALRAELKPRSALALAEEAYQRAIAQPRNAKPCDFGWTAKEIAVEKSAAGVATKALLVSRDGRLEAPVFLAVPTGCDGRTVLALALEAKAGFLKQRRAEIEGLLRAKVAVCFVDVPGTGETRSPGDGRGRSSGATSQASLAHLLGFDLGDLRADAAAGALAFLEQRLGGKVRVAVWGESFAQTNDPARDLKAPYDAEGFPALAEPLGAVAALDLARRTESKSIHAVLARGGLGETASVFRSPFLYVPCDVLDRLAPVSYEHTARDVGQRGVAVRLEGLVDGLNRPAADEAVRRATGPRVAASATRSDAHATVRWLVDGLAR